MRAFILTFLPLALAQPMCNRYYMGSLFPQSAGYDEKNSVECTCEHSEGIEWDRLDWPVDRQSPLSATCTEGEYCLVGVGDPTCSASPIARCGNTDGTRSNGEACMCTDGADGQSDIICAPPFNYCDFDTNVANKFYLCKPFDEACNNPSACGGADRRETCTVVPSQQKHICTCKLGYSGEHCEIGPCTDAPCKNGGTCTNDAASYRCDCLGDWSGPTCEVAPAPKQTSAATSLGVSMSVVLLAGYAGSKV